MSWTTPKTWTVGSPATSSDLNAYVRDNTAFLYGDTTWTSPTFTNSWGSFSGLPVGFRKVGTRVVFQGGLAGGTAGSSAFTLPTGYRPTLQRNFIVDSTASGLANNVAVTAAGLVIPSTPAGNAYVSLDGITFDTI